MISESLHNAVQELKRVDHLVYVSLKYTRTVDVLLNIISRMIDGYDEMWDALIEKLINDKVVDHVPSATLIRSQTIMKHYDHPQIKESVMLFELLRKLHRSNPEREQEYRRHVAMRTIIDGREEIVNIDVITQYYHIQKEFLSWLSIFLQPDVDAQHKEEAAGMKQ